MASTTHTLPRRILLGVSGGIAAYKTAFLVRELVKAGAEVQVVMTPSAHEFVTPLTLATLSGRPVLTDLVDHAGDGTWNDHVHLARWADALVIAPATANSLAKMAHGLCDNLLLACYLSVPHGDPEGNTPVFVAPAMDLEMFRDAATQANLQVLQGRGVHVIGPETGELASGLYGEGRMTEPGTIVEVLRDRLVPPSRLRGRPILISAGPTYEPIDPVRFIGNRSTGRMGFALADEAARRGAQVTLVAGPVSMTLDRAGVRRVDVTTAAEMADVCHAVFPDCDAAILCAAVADWRVAKPAGRKMKKTEGPVPLQLEPTEDILAWCGSVKRPGQLLVGFALETDNEEANAMGKLERKNADIIVLNSLRDAGAGFGHDTNQVTLLQRHTTPQQLPLMSKTRVAAVILDRLESLFPDA